MRQVQDTTNVGIRRPTPALIIALLALAISLSGTVYAAGKINGKTVKMKSLPGNRLSLRSVPANRLKPGILPGPQNPITGAQINELSFGPVPTAIFAETADRAQSALDAQTALNAVNAVNATKINGFSAGCLPGTRQFGGACWESSSSEVSMTAPNAAISCTQKGAALPTSLELAAFSQQPGVSLDAGGEWSGDIVSFTGANVFAVATVSTGAPPVIGSAAFNAGGSSATREFRCVFPLVK